MKKIHITSGEHIVEAELNDSPTALAIWDYLPIVGKVNTWGDEIYFTIPVVLDEAPDAREEVSIGDLGYWAPGHAFCIFFGPTPASHGKNPRAASPVNVFGKVIGKCGSLKQVRSGAKITISKVDSE